MKKKTITPKQFGLAVVLGIFGSVTVFATLVAADPLAKTNTKIDQCMAAHSTDSSRNAAVIAVEFEYHKMGKSYLLQGKTDDNKIYMFCEATSK